MLEPLRRVAVHTVKPYVSEDAWARLRAVAPRKRKRKPVRKPAPAAVAPAPAPVAAPAPTAEAAPAPAPPPKPKKVPLSERSLPELATHFGTDKWGTHRFAKHYQTHFAGLKDEEFGLLEIGIGGYQRDRSGGASLRMWKHFFPNAQIYGLDIYDKSFVNEDRITAFKGSQTNAPLLRTIAATAGDLRIVVDDGSHRPEHIRETFAALFPLLADGGLYAIEDTQTSYWPRWGGSFDLQDPTTTMALVKDLIDGLHWEEWSPTGREPSYTDTHIAAIHCYHNLVIIEKGENREGTTRSPNWDKPVEAEADAPGATPEAGSVAAAADPGAGGPAAGPAAGS